MWVQYILAEGWDILKLEDFWLYAGACGGRKTIVRFRSAHRASLLTAVLAEVLPGVCLCVGFSESLRICLQSSYSRQCGGYRRLPTDRKGSGQVPLLLYMLRIIFIFVYSRVFDTIITSYDSN